jgi:hypothetical protein
MWNDVWFRRFRVISFISDRGVEVEEQDLWIFFVDLDAKATNCEKPGLKQTQLPVILLN